MRARRVFVLGVTGGMGSGKSTVCRILRDQFGAHLFLADEVAKRLMMEDVSLREDVQKRFGRDVYAPDGTLQRATLAGRVFGDPSAVRDLNALVHPRVFAAGQQFREDAACAGAPFVVHEAALLLQAGGAKRVDAVLVVDAPEEVRIQRAVLRDGSSEAAVRARLVHQWTSDQLRAHADYIIENVGSEADLRAATEKFYATWLVPRLKEYS